MDILNPDLHWIDGICCRFRYLGEGSQIVENNTQSNVDKPDLYGDDSDESEDEEIYTQLNNGRIKTSLPVAQCFLGYLIGTKGATKKRIENETRTEIKIPTRGQSGEVFVTGSDKKSVSMAVRRIKLIIIGARQKQSITHFLSIPINSSTIRENYNTFKEEILESPWGKNIHESVFIVPEKLHITLITMFLGDEGERNIAKDVLENSCSSIILTHFENIEDLSFTLKGVSYMNDDPKSVNVLYANVVENDLKINELAEKLRDVYTKTGYLSRNRTMIKLHVTLMNTRNSLDDNDLPNEDKNCTKRITFDATHILEKYKDYEFGKQAIKEIHLSQRGSTNSDGYYQPTSVVSL